MSRAILEAALVVAQQQHGPPRGAHLMLLAGVVIAAVAIFGVKWWRGRRDGATTDEGLTRHDRSADSTRPRKEE